MYMKRNHRKRSPTAEVYAALFLLLTIVMGFVFSRKFAFYVVSGGRFLLCSVIVSILTPLLLLLFVRKRSRMGLLCTALPYLVYEMITLSFGMGYVGLLLIAVILFSISCGNLWRIVKSFCCHRSVSSAAAIRFAAILLTILLVPCCMFVHNRFIEMFSDAMAPDILQEKTHREAHVPPTEEALHQALTQIFQEDWSACSEEEKLAALNTVLTYDCAYLGIPTVPDLRAAALPTQPERVLGQYLTGQNLICLSRDALAEKSGPAMLKVLLHENRHCYQAALVALYASVPEEYKDLELFDSTKTFAFEQENYIRPDGSDTSFEQYYTQRMETDANHYAEKRLIDYQAKIKE